MPRHLISDAHEWINEIPTVPIYYLAKPQPRLVHCGHESPVSQSARKPSDRPTIHNTQLRNQDSYRSALRANPFPEVTDLFCRLPFEITDTWVYRSRLDLRSYSWNIRPTPWQSLERFLGLATLTHAARRNSPADCLWYTRILTETISTSC